MSSGTPYTPYAMHSQDVKSCHGQTLHLREYSLPLVPCLESPLITISPVWPSNCLAHPVRLVTRLSCRSIQPQLQPSSPDPFHPLITGNVYKGTRRWLPFSLILLFRNPTVILLSPIQRRALQRCDSLLPRSFSSYTSRLSMCKLECALYGRD